jgi:mono/diheme cytochrome c family protein
MRGMIALALAGALGACSLAGSRDALAEQTIADHCGACHTVPGVARARGRVGPDLGEVHRQQVIGGRLSNNRPNMIRWITHAQDIAPGSAMPNIPLSDAQAGAVADYLYSLD